MANIDKTYHHLLETIMDEGFTYEDPNRKDVNRVQIPSYTFKHDFKDGFPAITTKKLYWKGIVGELLWILRGDTNIKYLVDNNINIWNKDAHNFFKRRKFYSKGNDLSYESFMKAVPHNNHHAGKIGRGYGAQLRNWATIHDNPSTGMPELLDQFAELINTLKTNPMATKKTVTFWNPAEKDECALTPCHWSFEILVEPIKQFSRECFAISEKCDIETIPKYQFTLKWHQHSVDTFLGLPFNIASYALLAQIIGKMTNMVPKSIIGDLSNVHIYEPHMEAVKEQLNRNVNKYGECNLDFSISSKNKLESLINLNNLDVMLNNLNIKDFKLKNYKSYPRIPAEMLAYNK